MGQVGATLERAAKLASGDHLLAGVAAFFEAHAANRFVVQHLGHKCFKNRLREHGNARSHTDPGPGLGCDGRAIRQGRANRCAPESAHHTGARGQYHDTGLAVVCCRPGLPAVCALRGDSVTHQTDQAELRGGVTELGFGAQYKH